MVAAKPDSTQQPHASSAVSAPPPSAEEEALKRNTDCVYFLASPLTCKKGSECEYRHSDYARVNPRDCYYWLNGNCLNPKCAFRHPPLDALLGTQTATAAAPLPPQAAVSMPPAVPVPASYGSAKQAVPCVFFQQGYCMKGDRCSFSHGTNPIGNKLQQPSVPMPSTELSSYKKPPGILNRCSQQQKATPGLPKPQSAPKPLPDSRKHAPLARNMKEETPRYEASIVNGRSSRLNHPHVQDDRSIQHDRETEEYMRESSPGFDVLVDDERGDADYYHGEDQYGTHEQQYNIDHPADYASLPDVDPRMVGWEHRRNPSDQMVAYAQSETPDVDLRHRLKQRRVNGGLRSVVSSDFVPGRGSVDERRQRVPSKERSVGGRLKGRLKFPERSGANGNGLLHRDREMDRERNWDSNRLRGRIQEHYNSEDRGILGHPPRMRREFLDGNRGPSIIQRQQDALSFPDQQGDGNVSFEGPKPLSVLLKRKRGAVDDNGLNGENRASKTEETEHDSSPQSKEGEEEKAEIADAQVNPVEKEDDRLVEGEAEHEEGDEYEYEQVDGEGEFNYEGDNAEEEEYLDDEDDDFAKKVGVMFS